MNRGMIAALVAVTLVGCSLEVKSTPATTRPATTTSTSTTSTTTVTLTPRQQALADIRLYVPALDRTPDDHMLALVDAACELLATGAPMSDVAAAVVETLPVELAAQAAQAINIGVTRVCPQ